MLRPSPNHGTLRCLMMMMMTMMTMMTRLNKTATTWRIGSTTSNNARKSHYQFYASESSRSFALFFTYADKLVGQLNDCASSKSQV